MSSEVNRLAPLSTTVDDRIRVRDRDLARDLVGSLTFTEMFLLDLDGDSPTVEKVTAVDAILVAMMEHGITPSTLAARLVLDAAPEALQGAVSAGLLATGSRFLGTIEQAARACADVVRDVGLRAEQIDWTVGLENNPWYDSALASARRCAEHIREAGGRVPGLGHNLHQETDPRVETLIAVAHRTGFAGPHLAALVALQAAGREVAGSALVINAAGVIGALVADLGYGPDQARGFALVARCAGIFAHIVDEQRRPIARRVWSDVHRQESENPTL